MFTPNKCKLDFEFNPYLDTTRYDLERDLFKIGRKIGLLKIALGYNGQGKLKGQERKRYNTWLHEYQVAWYYHLKSLEDKVYKV